jgi:hypothetical protein
MGQRAQAIPLLERVLGAREGEDTSPVDRAWVRVELARLVGRDDAPRADRLWQEARAALADVGAVGGPVRAVLDAGWR